MDQGNREAPGEIMRTLCVNTPSPLGGPTPRELLPM
jgi:hypothetical protein